jgi:hypothetical protein
VDLYHLAIRQKEANRILERAGDFWEKSFDHLIRKEDERPSIAAWMQAAIVFC